MAKDRWGRELNTNAPDYIRASAQRQAERVEAEYGATAYGSRAYLTPEGAKQMDDYNTAVRMKKYYDDWSGLKYLSKEDEEKRRKQLEALRNDYSVTSRYNTYSDLLDYGEAQINSASRYRSYDEWGQSTGDKTYMGNLQNQLDNLQSKLTTAQQNMSNMSGNEIMNYLATGEYQNLVKQQDINNSKLQNAALNVPDDKYLQYDAMSTEELGARKTQLENEKKGGDGNTELSTLVPQLNAAQQQMSNMSGDEIMNYLATGEYQNLLGKVQGEQKSVDNELRYINSLLETRERQSIYEGYAKKMNEEDFDGEYDSSIDDLEYRTINNDISGNEIAGATQWKLSHPVGQMSDDERKIYNSIYKNEGKEAATEFLTFLEKDLNFRQRIEDEATAREYAQESPWGASFLSVISRLASPVEAGAQITHLALGDYDENAYYNAASRFTTNVRDQVSRDIAADSGETWAWVYNTGMSVADNLAQMGLGGGAGTLMMMGTAVFSDALVQGRDAGLSDSEIIADATVRTLIEIATEKIGLDEVMKVVKGAGGMQVLRSALAEGGEEGLSNIGNLFYDEIKAAVTGNESEIKEEVRKLMDAGYSESEAAAIVIGNKAKDFGLDVLSGFVSGLAMSGGSYVGSISLEKAERYAKETFDGSVEKALTLGDDSDVFKMAEQFQNEPPTNRMMKEVAKIKLINATDKATTKLLKESTDAYAKELESVDVEDLPKKVEEIANRIVMESKGATQEASTEVETDEEGNETTKETKEKSDLGKTDILLAALGAARIRVFENKLRDQILKTNATTEEGSVDMADKILRLGENATIQLSNGEIIDLNNLDFKGDGALNAAYKNAVQGLRRTSDANTYIADFKSLNGQVSAEFFDTLWKTAYKMHGATVENVKSSEAVATLLSAYEEVARADGVAFNMGAIETVIKHAQQMGNESAIRVTEASKKLVNEMAALTNTKVEFVDNLVDKDGNSVQGLYDTETKTIKISTTTRNPATVVFCHELTHAMQDANPEVYALYKKAVLRKLSSNGANYTFIETQVKNSYPKREGQSTEEWMDEVNDEIVAIASENFLVESAFVDQLKKNKNVFRKVRNVILNRYQRVGIDIVRNRMNDMEKEDYEWFTKLTSLWVDIASQADLDEAALEEYRKELIGEEMPNGDLPKETMEEVKEKVEKQEMVTPQAETQFSREFDDDFMTKAEKKNLKKVLVDEAVLAEARKVRERTKELLEQYKQFLPEDKMGKNWKTKNGSYGLSGDLGTVCIRSLAVEPLMDFIADKIGHPLTAEETQFISQELMSYTHMPPCIYCYVAMDRNAKRDYLNRYINWREDTIKNFRSGMSEEEVKEAFLRYDYKSGKRTMKETGALRDRFNDWKRMAFDPSAEKISKSDLTSTAKAEERKKVSAEYKKQINDAMRYAQSASYAKGVVGYTAYNGDILKWKQKKIDDLNSQFGMRMYSFTDYHPAFVLENMQMITDASVMGLKVLAYTKEVDFARIFMRTGANINISVTCQMQKNENGEFVQDGMMGADWEAAKKARAESDKFGGNVGITFVAFNDEQVEWACQQDWVDVVIPFHTVKAEEFVELNGFTNYKAVQEETKKSDFNKDIHKREIMPEMHGNDFATYQAALEENHLNAKFNEKWYQKWGVNGDATTQKWYMKLVNETRRSYNDTMPVQPIFNYDAAEESIRSLDKPYGAPIGTTAEGYEDITIEEIAKDISDKMGSQTFSDSRFSRDFEDVGYHAGDLGKAESLFNQSGSRDTGHFGTGTYFVGDEEKINRYDYGKRPHEKVNFEKYNLFKPKNYSDASKLHQFMRRVDGWIGQYEGSRSTSEYNDYKEQLEDATYEFSDNGQQETINDIDAWFFSDFEAEERRSDSEIIDDVVRLARLTIGSRDLARVIADHSNREVYSDGDRLILNDGIYETEFTPEEYLKRVPRDMAENIMDWVSTEANDWRSRGLDRANDYETWHNDFEDVANILGVSIDTLENAITEATQEADAINYPESMTSDSIATRVMKRLGYEGVDVRHINDMDNTKYGSVIYDLKGEDLARKQEIGTARFSKEFDNEYMELAQDPEKNAVRLRELVKQAAEAAGYPTHLYHGTDAFGFTSVDLDATGADGFSFWASDNPDVSGSYTSNGYVRKISENNVDNDELLELTEQQIEDTVDIFRHLIDTTFSEWYFGQTDNSYIIDGLYAANPEAGYGDGVYDFLDEIVADAFYQYSDMDNRDFDEWQESPEGQAIYDVVVELEGLLSKYHKVENGDTAGGVYDLYANTDNFYTVDGRNKNWNNLSLPNIVDRTWIMFTDDNGEQRVQYSDNSGEEQDISYDEASEMLGWSLMDKLEVRWFEDDYGEISTKWDTENNKLGKPSKTRDLAAYARENGYDGVRFHNIHDNGKYGGNLASDVYAFFKPNEQVKSADLVTYDDNGNIIPLSERFNKTNEDIRYAKEFTDEETNAVSSNDIKRVADVLSDADVSKVKLSDEQVRKIAERILRGRGSEYSTDDLAANLKKAFAYWTQNKGTNYAALVQVMQDFMMPVVESIYDYSGDQRRRDTLIGTTFVVSEEAAKKADIKNINRRLFGYGIAFTTDAESVSSDREVVNLAENWYHETTDGSVEGVAIDLNIDHTLTDEAEMVEAIRDFVTTERGEAATQVVSPQFREGYAFDLALEAFQEFINESRVSIDEISRRANADAGKLVRENKSLRSRNAHLHDRIDQLRNEYKEKYLNMVSKNKDIVDRKKSRLQEQADKAKQLDRLQREWKRLENYVNKPNRGRHINASYKKYLEYLADMVDLTTNRKSKRNDALDALADEYRRLSKLEQYEDRPYDDTIEMKLREVNDMVAGRPIRELNSSEIKEVVDVVRAFIKRATTMDEFTQKELARKYENVQEASRQTINNIDKSRGLTNKDSLADKWLTMQLSPMREVERLTDFHADDPLFLAAENILRAEIKVNEYKMNFALMFKEMQPNQYKRGTDEWKKAREFRKRYDKMNETYVKVRLGGVEREITEAQKLELIMQSRNEDSMRHILFGGLLVPDLEQLKKGHWNTAYTSGTIVRPFEIEMLRLSKGLDEFQTWFLEKSVNYFNYASKLINQTSFELEGFARAEVENYYPIRVATNYTSQKNYDVLTGMQDSGESIDSDMLKARVKSKLPIYLNGINQSLQRHQNFVSRYAALAIPMSDFQKIYGAKVREEVPKYYHDVLETINGMKGGSLVRDDIVKDFKEKFFMVTDSDGNVVTGDLKNEVLRKGNNKRGSRVQIGDNIYSIENNVNEALEWSGIASFLENRGKNVTKADILDFINNRGIPELNPVKNVLEAKWGHHATNYLNNALKDLAGNRPMEQGLLDKARGNAAQAILTLNPSVSIKQAASFPTAIAELDYISVSHALMRGGRNNWMLSRADHDLINKYTGVLYGRQMGMTTQEIAEMSTNPNKNVINKAMDAVPWLTNWIQKIDVATVGRLWYATEYWVQRHNQDYKDGKLKKGSDEYYQTVARKFEMVVTKTQPNYSVFTRPDILRSKNQLTRAVLMFKTQPLQNFNIMYESVARVNAKIRQYNQAKGTPQALAIRGELNAAWAKLARSISSQLVQTAVFTGMTFLANALILHRWDKYKDEDINEVTFASVMEQVMWDYLGSFFGNAVGGDWFEDIASFVVRRFAFDEDVMLNGISIMGIDSINDTYELIDKITKAFQDGDPTAAWKNVIKMAQKMSAVWGIPAENILKVFESAWMYKQDIFDDYNITDVDREGIPVLFNFQETTNEQYWNRVKRAYEQGDTEQVKERFEDMIESTKSIEEKKDGTKYTKIGAAGLLKADDESGVMEWVSDLYLHGSASDKQMVEDWLDDIVEYNSDPRQSKANKIKAFYEFQEEELPAEYQPKDSDAYLDWEFESYGNQFDKAFTNYLSGRDVGTLPTKKGEGACSTQMARLWQNSTDKEAVWRFAVDVLGYKESGKRTTTKGWEEKDLSDRY